MQISCSTLNITKLNDNAIIPTKGSDYAAGSDLYACILNPIVIDPHKTVKIPTGLAIEIPTGYFGAIFARSGIATKNGLRPANCVPVIDSDYRGEWMIPMHNDTDENQIINPNDRISQLVVIPYLSVKFNEVYELSETKRGVNGFGSTGK